MSRKEVDALKGVFREDAWATPLLALSVIALCALLLYTVVGFCSWYKPATRSSTLLPWLQMPLLLGLMCLASTSIIAAVPLNDAACRMLFLGPGFGYVLVTAGLLSRIIQHSLRTHVVLQWLLLFFVCLNQMVISVAYLVRSTRNKCQLTVHDQLLVMLYPGLLVGVVLLLVYRTARRTRSRWKSREAIHIGLAATFSGAFAGCWLGAASVLGDGLLSSSLGYGCLATVIVVSLISLIPRQEHMPPRLDDSIYSEKDDVYVERVARKPVYHHGPGRGSEKPIPKDPGIIIVPVKSSGKDLADIKNRNGHHHHHANNNRRQREHRESGRFHHHHHHQQPEQQHRAHRWATKLRSDLTASRRIKAMRSRKEAASRGLARNIADGKAAHRTPYNHRGWLY